MDKSLAETPMFAWHRDHEGRMVDFAGWSMPVQYRSIVAEHEATRQRAALFDVSHMGRFRFTGAGVAPWLDGLLTRSVAELGPGRIRYSLVTGDDGGILDDVLIYRMPATAGELSVYYLVVNASNRAKIWSWLQAHPDAGEVAPGDVQAVDVTRSTAMIAVQGPMAVDLVAATFGLTDVRKLANYTGYEAIVEAQPWVISRTGYTGEDGLELIVPAQVALAVWERLLSAGSTQAVTAAGLGARDTLRLEAAMPLYGHELSESITPWQAGLQFAVDLKGRMFPGRDALARSEGRPTPVRVGLRLHGKRVAREQARVLAEPERPIGEVTSGTFSPTLQQSLAMAYVDPASALVGTRLLVDVRGKLATAEVVPLPFYRRANSSRR